VFSGTVGSNFVGETEREKWWPLAHNYDCGHICSLRQKVGEIDPLELVLPIFFDVINNSY